VRTMRISLGKVVLLQWAVTALAMGLLVLWGLITGKGYVAAWSLWLGAGCALIPNSLFAVRLWIDKIRRRIPSPVFIFVVEFLKIGTTVLLMVLVVKLYHDLVWWAFLLGLVVVLKSYLLTLFWAK